MSCESSTKERQALVGTKENPASSLRSAIPVPIRKLDNISILSSRLIGMLLWRKAPGTYSTDISSDPSVTLNLSASSTVTQSLILLPALASATVAPLGERRTYSRPISSRLMLGFDVRQNPIASLKRVSTFIAHPLIERNFAKTEEQRKVKIAPLALGFGQPYRSVHCGPACFRATRQVAHCERTGHLSIAKLSPLQPLVLSC